MARRLPNGVTSARDMAKHGYVSSTRRASTTGELGPRVQKAGIIDGTGICGSYEDAGRHRRAGDLDVDWKANYGYAKLRFTLQSTERSDHC